MPNLDSEHGGISMARHPIDNRHPVERLNGNFFVVFSQTMLDNYNMTSVFVNETSTAIVETVMSTTSINDGPLVDSDAVSPVTLSMEWSRVARLLIMIGLSVIGSIGNVYMISSVMIEDHLNKRGKKIRIIKVLVGSSNRFTTPNYRC